MKSSQLRLIQVFLLEFSVSQKTQSMSEYYSNPGLAMYLGQLQYCDVVSLFEFYRLKKMKIIFNTEIHANLTMAMLMEQLELTKFSLIVEFLEKN
ncbi:hypothetical protein T09_8399 [Trichinella sp. T9]|nr:hypothetical protein T09_8399 [Trichinella sp. T9]